MQEQEGGKRSTKFSDRRVIRENSTRGMQSWFFAALPFVVAVLLAAASAQATPSTPKAGADVTPPATETILTPSGAVRGVKETEANVSSFKGIPYAAAPV